MNARLLWVDTETSGMLRNSPVQNKHAIVQIAAVITDRNNDLTVRGYFMQHIKFNDQLIWDPGAENVHHKSRASLEREPDEQMAAEAFTAFCQAFSPLRFAGFNCPFDLAFVCGMCERHGTFLPEFVTPHYDVMDIAKKQLKDKGLPNNKLVTIREYFGIPTTGAHDAAHDIYDTIKIARLLRQMELAAA